MSEYHIVISCGVGGNSSKSTHVLMLSTFLSLAPDTATVVIIDLTATMGVGKGARNVYRCFRNIFGFDEDDVSGYVGGYEYINAPRDIQRHSRNLVVVRGGGADLADWQELSQRVININKELSRRFQISHTIVETNLPAVAPNMGSILQRESWAYSNLWIWTTWLRDSIQDTALYDTLIRREQAASHNKNIHWYFVHNPFADIEDRDENGDMPAIRDCFLRPNHKPPTSNSYIKHIKQTVGERALSAIAEGYRGNTYWEHIFADFSESRPRCLLPVYRRSEEFFALMSGQFESRFNCIEDPQTLSQVLNCNDLYSSIYEPFFSSIGI